MYLGTVQHGLWEVHVLGKYGSVLLMVLQVSCWASVARLQSAIPYRSMCNAASFIVLERVRRFGFFLGIPGNVLGVTQVVRGFLLGFQAPELVQSSHQCSDFIVI